MKIVEKWKATNPNYRHALVLALVAAASFGLSKATQPKPQPVAAPTPQAFMCFNGAREMTTYFPNVLELYGGPDGWSLRTTTNDWLVYKQAFGEACITKLVPMISTQQAASIKAPSWQL